MTGEALPGTRAGLAEERAKEPTKIRRQSPTALAHTQTGQKEGRWGEFDQETAVPFIHFRVGIRAQRRAPRVIVCGEASRRPRPATADNSSTSIPLLRSDGRPSSIAWKGTRDRITILKGVFG